MKENKLLVVISFVTGLISIAYLISHWLIRYYYFYKLCPDCENYEGVRFNYPIFASRFEVFGWMAFLSILLFVFCNSIIIGSHKSWREASKRVIFFSLFLMLYLHYAISEDGLFWGFD